MTLDCAKKLLGDKTTTELLALETIIRTHPILTKNSGKILKALNILLHDEMKK
jgi:hypothetical protein